MSKYRERDNQNTLLILPVYRLVSCCVCSFVYMYTTTKRFGSMYYEHAGPSRWPGFVLLPSIIDMHVLWKDMLVDVPGTNDNEFETNLAMKLWDSGFVTGHLPGSENYKKVGGQQ